MRSIIIGDIHGCSQALNALLQKLNPDPARDRLIFLGDLFDRGPDSFGVFETVRQLSAAYGDRFVLLRGNHEDYLLSASLTLSQRLVWQRVGRGATVRSFKSHGASMEDAIPWLDPRCQLFYKGEGFQCVHAGLRVDPPEDNDRDTLLHDHEVTLENRYAGPLTVTGHIAIPFPTHFAGDGETTRELPLGEWLPLPETGVICIDTGCGKGGWLTGMTVEAGRFRLDPVSERGS
ncbi:MAG: serine/threonine protein phosphatase [Clostridia bacterium]|nr:serine/threonine protein phosphatase [Clostridia bacterium]